MKNRFLLLLVFLVAVVLPVQANPVDMRTAREVAAKFMNANARTTSIVADDLQLVTTYRTADDDAAFHVFNVPHGYVIVSAVDCARPILGYSTEGQFDVNNIPIQLQDYLQGFVEQIQYGIENHLEADETRARQWELVKTIGRLTNHRTDEAVEPLVTTRWDQNSPYNLFTPNHCVTGCVATAMAQVMKFWNWPVQGTGEHSYVWHNQTLTANFGETIYDWDNMLDSYGSQSTQEQREAVATLMYHCGVSVDMYYGSAISVALLSTSSLINYFNYSDEMSFESRNNYSEASWEAKIKDCLNLGRPLYYDGYRNESGQDGHAFVCDGYDNNDLFHLNWGWGGSANGYFALDAISYIYNCGAVFNMHPQGDEPTVYEINVSVHNDEGGTAIGGGTFIHGDTVTLMATADEGYCFQYWVENGGVASTDPNYTFRANFNRDLMAVFTGPVTVSVSALEGGTVSGGGIFCYEECEVIATPNEGYDFAYWTVNDNIVSVEADYIFIITGETHLIAHFIVEGNIDFADDNVKAICLNRWDYNGDGELSLAEAASVTNLGQAFKNKTNITSFDELQYFTNLAVLGDSEFYQCSNLASLTLPNSVTTIGDSAFKYCSSLIGPLTLPDAITSIGSSAFYGCSRLTSLTLPNAITSIGGSAFYGCTKLTSLTLPNSLTTIGSYAFYNCSGLKGSLTIPNSITVISASTFYGCKGLTSLNLPNSVTTIGDSAFSNCSGLTGTLVLSDFITSIGGYAFSGCTGLTSLILPNSITTISNYAFRGCSRLTSLTIPEAVTSIGTYAFYGCSGMTSLTIPNSVVSIGNNAFYDCNGLTSIVVLAETPPTIEHYTFSTVYNVPLYVPCQSVGTYQSNNSWNYFSNINGLCSPGTITLAADPTEHGEVTGAGTYESGTFCTVTATPNEGYYFANWTENGNVVSTDANYSFVVTGDRLLTAHFVVDGIIVFADANVKAICVANWDTNGDGELSYAEAARVINIGEIFRGNMEITSFDELQYFVNLSSVCNNAFYGCGGLVSLTFPSSVTKIDGSAFRDCIGLIGLPLLNSITEIGNYAFSGCTGLTSLTLPNALISIGDYAFSGCSGLAGDLTIPNSVTTIGSYAFSDCNGFMGNLTLGDSVTTIGSYAFSGCNGFTGDLTIPNAVTVIGNYAFNGCNGFTGNLTLGNSVGTIGNYAFYNCNGFTGDLTIPDLVTSIGNYAFNSCTGFTGNLTLGESVYSIGNYAFNNCSGFTGDLIFPNSVEYIRDYAFRGCSGFTGDLTLGESVSSIGNYAFYYCTGFMGHLTMGESIYSIGNYAFYYCYGLTGNLTFGNSLRSIGNEAFCYCQGLTGGLTIPNSVISIGEYAFCSLYGLRGSLTIGSSVTSIGKYAFSGSDGLCSAIVLAQQPPTLGTSVFSNEFTNNIPLFVPCESVETYQSAAGWDAFLNIMGMCSSGTVSVVADPVEGGIVSGAGTYEGGNSCTVTATPNEGYYFANWTENGTVVSCDSIYTFIVAGDYTMTAHFVPEGIIDFADANVKAICVDNWDANGDGELSYFEAASVTSLGYAFRYNTEITSFEELQYFISLPSIRDYSFYDCYNLTTLTLPNSVSSIDDYAFCNCGLTSLTIPNSVTSIGYCAFESCGELKGTLTISNSVTSIGDYAFSFCSSLTSLIIGNSVTSMGNYAFSYCYNLKSMHVLAEQPPVLESYTFYQVPTNIPVYVPCESVEAYQTSAGWDAFSNLLDMCSSGTISVVADPVEGGTVSGAGTYEGGAPCTIIASPNEGYCFAYWTENGSVVSDDSICSFIVTGDRALTAHFVPLGNIVFADANVKAICVDYWDANGDGELSYLEAAAVTSLDGMFAYNMEITSFEELQYFISLSSIGDYEFHCCYNLTSVKIPNAVTSIGICAFGECGLTGSLTIGDSVTSIGGSAFYSCYGLVSLTIGNSVTSIGNYAFSDCYGLTSLTIGNSVTLIGENAFYYSEGLRSMVVLSETPPTVESNAFYQVPTNIPVYVPCESAEAYQSALGWDVFSNIVDMCSPGTVTVVADPAEGGTVSGAGTFESGTSCTVTATSNEGFSFANWTNNGVVVSNDSIYSFIVTGESVVTAHFVPDGNIVFADANVKAICVDNWDTNGDGELSYLEAAMVTSLGDMFSYNTEITSFEELQFFIGLYSIDNYAFYGCNGLTGSLILPNSINSIGESAFYDCYGLTGSLTIPDAVTWIGYSAFENCTGFTGPLTIGNFVSSIGDYAFENCTGLKGSLTIPNAVIWIGYSAFENCIGLSGPLTIGSSVTSIGSNAFYNCNGLNGSLNIPNSVTSIGSYAFYYCNGLMGNLTIPNSVTSIGDGAFYYCNGLTSLTIGNSVTSIGTNAFNYCTGLNSIIVLSELPPTLESNAFYHVSTNIPVYVPCESVETYQTDAGWNAFTNLMGLCSPGTVSVAADPVEGGTVSGAGTFEGGAYCTVTAMSNEGFCFANWTENGSVVSYDSIYSFIVTGESVMTAHFVPDGNIVFADANVKAICVDNWDTNGDGELSYLEAASVSRLGYKFMDNSEITSFEELQYFIGLTSIHSYAFYNCSGLSGSLNIPNSVTSIGEYAFYNCRNLTGPLTIPNSVTSIGNYAFYYCYGLTGSLTIPNSVTSIGGCAFYCCSGLTGPLTLPNAITSIGNRVFYYCYGLTGSLTIPNTVTSIGYGAFEYCANLTGSLIIPNSVTSIGDRAFNNCYGLTGSLIIPGSVTSIGSYTFANCYGLTSLTIPNSVTSIGSNAFYYCYGLTSLTIPNSVTSIGDSAFSGCYGLTSLTIPNSVTSIGSNTFYNCYGLTSLTIPNSVTSIGSYAFYNCYNLTGSLIIPDAVSSIGNYAFSNCYGLKSMIVMPETPPTVEANAFYRVPADIPVYVPCESFETYQSSGGWDVFSNMMGLCSSGTVSVAADPAEGGLVSGTGMYEGGSSCTVTATPNQGYFFANWTENGRVVSSNSTYHFIVTGESTLIAHFVPDENIVFADANVKAICVDNWDANNDGELSYYEAASVTSLGFAFRDHTEITSFDELQHFINLTTIGNYAFYGCNGLSSLAVPNSVTTIGNYAFNGCYGLTDPMIIPEFVTSIGSYSYYNCRGLTGPLNIPNSVVIIGSYAFYSCNNLTSLTLPNSVISIYDNAFNNCTGLTGSLTLPNAITSIGYGVFGNCRNLTGSLTIPNSVTSIGSNAFYNCNSLTSLTISNSVTTIGSSAFSGCSGFTGELTIPNSVTSIGGSAFYGCSGFTGDLVIPNSVTTLGSYAFGGCSGFTGSLTISKSITSIGSYAFNNCYGLTGSLTIGASVTSIGDHAFYNCNNLASVTMLSLSVPTLGSDAFSGSRSNYYIYVPYSSLNAYKTATNWNNYESRIFPMAYITILGYDSNINKWAFVASPLTEDIAPTTVDSMLSNSEYDLYQYDQSATDEEWQNYKVSNFNLVNGQGYLYANAEEVNVIFKGAFNENNSKEISLDYDEDQSYPGWNLVGNPFPVGAYANKSYYVMNARGTAIEPVAVSSSTTIAPCTGVMVKAEAIGESVTFSKTPETRSRNNGMLQIAVTKTDTQGNAVEDKVIVSFNESDQLPKVVFNPDTPKLCVRQGEKDYAIAHVDHNCESLDLYFSDKQGGDYTITVNAGSVEFSCLQLTDHVAGTTVDLLEQPTYTFHATGQELESRFSITFKLTVK